MTHHLGALIVLLAFAAAPAAAHAQAQTSTSAQHDGGVTGLIGTCEGESSVVTDGAITSVLHTTDDANGGSHLVVHDVFRIPGTGEVTGDRYLWMSSGHFVVNGGSGASTVSSGGHTMNLAPGPSDDSSQQATFHTTENSNGDLTSQVIHERSQDCG